MTTPLSLFATFGNSPIQPSAMLFVSVSGGGSASNPQPMGTATAWGQIEFGNFTAWSSAGSIGSPDGNGALYDAGFTTLAGQTIPAGNWSGSFIFFVSQSGKTVTGPITLRAYKWNKLSTVYTAIGSITTTSQVINNAGITVAFTATSLPSVSFAAAGTESLYFDLWDHVSANTMTSGGGIGLLFSASTTLGYSGAVVVTPGFSPTTTFSRIIASDSMAAGISPGGVF